MKAERIERESSIRFGFHGISWQGAVSCLLLIAQIILLLVALYVAYDKDGRAGIQVGVLGLITCILSVAGIVTGILGLFRRDMNHGLCLIGLIGSIVPLAAVIVMSLTA